MKPVALTIAGSDPSGGAGIQADLKTFHQFGVYGEAVITLVTVQNTVCVSRVECMDPELIAQQITAVIEDIPPGAAKTGALGNIANVRMVAEMARFFQFPLVVDPVMISKHGAPLIDLDAIAVIREKLLPRAELVTPNLPEAETLTGEKDPRKMAEALINMGAKAALIKGGHAKGPAIDYLLLNGEWIELPGDRIDTPHTHGTGCTYSAAITAGIAKGESILEAVRNAKAYIARAIATNPGLGSGNGPVNHHA